MRKLDQTDMKILTSLVQDSSMSVPKLSKKININASVVYSRIKRLIKRGLIKKFTIIVDEELLGYTVSAVIGLNIDSKLRGPIIEKILEMYELRSISEVTGRFDILVEITAQSLDQLHNIVSDKMGKIEGIVRTETFLKMKKRDTKPKYVIDQ